MIKGQVLATTGTPIDLSDAQTADKVNFVLSRGSVIAGRIVDDGGEPISGTRYRRCVSVHGRPAAAGSGRRGGTDRYAPTYFPGTPNISEATRVTVRTGQEMTSANFALIVARMARDRGRVINSRGEPVSGAMLMMVPDEMMIGPMNMNNAMVGGDGAFQFANVAPGRYNLQVRPNGMPSATSEFATMKVTVGNDDVENLLVATSVGATARGVVLTDDGAVPSFRPDQVSIFASPAEPMTFMVNPGQNRINDDFTFELTSLSERRLIRASIGQNSGWYLKAILLDGEDVTDSGIEFTPGRSYDGLQVIFSQKSTDLSGLLTDDRGKPVLDATVVIFPANKELWTFSSRYVRSARSRKRIASRSTKARSRRSTSNCQNLPPRARGRLRA